MPTDPDESDDPDESHDADESNQPPPDPAPVLDALINEQADLIGGDPPAGSLYEAPGEPLLRGSDLAPLFIFAVVVDSDPPGVPGSDILSAFKDVANTHVSPGTIYPILDDLRDQGALKRTQLVRTYPYQLDDATVADDILAQYESRLGWWLWLCRDTRAALDANAPDETETETETESDSNSNP